MVAVQQRQQYPPSCLFGSHNNGRADIVANPKHVEIVRQGQKAIDLFRHSQKKNVFGAEGFDLTGANFSGANLRELTLGGSDLTGANLREADLTGAYMSLVNLTDADLTNATLEHTELTDTVCYGANLTNVKLAGASLSKAKLSRANLRGARMSAQTFIDAFTEVSGMKVNATTLEYLREKLTTSQMMDLEIDNDLVALRCEFGGVWGLMHLASVLAFLCPYVFFSIRLWFSSTDIEPCDGIQLWVAFLRYVLNGGANWMVGWNVNWMSVITALFFFAYNALRVSLLIKTKKLETAEAASRLPARFSFTDHVCEGWMWLTWEKLFRWVRTGFWVYLVFVAWHLFVFSLNHWVDVKSIR
jgi:hypothetical protein